MWWPFMTPRWEPQAKPYVLVLRNLQFSFQGITQEIDRDVNQYVVV